MRIQFMQIKKSKHQYKLPLRTSQKEMLFPDQITKRENCAFQTEQQTAS